MGWKRPVIQDILAESGFVELVASFPAHLTVNWTTSTWDENRESRSNLFSVEMFRLGH